MKGLVLITSVIVASCLIAMVIINTDVDHHMEDYDSSSPDGTDKPESGYYILILCNENRNERYTELFTSVADDLDIADLIPEQHQADVVVIDDQWYSNNMTAANAAVEKLLEDGRTIISIGSTAVFMNSGHSSAFNIDSDENDVNIMSYDADTETYYCYTSSDTYSELTRDEVKDSLQ